MFQKLCLMKFENKLLMSLDKDLSQILIACSFCENSDFNILYLFILDEDNVCLTQDVSGEEIKVAVF